MTEEITKQNTLVPDAVAGLTTSIANIPDAMASAILVGVNPVFSLYALMVGTPVGALLTSSHFMLICTTSAMALTAGSALAHLDGLEMNQALFTLTLLVGFLSGFLFVSTDINDSTNTISCKAYMLSILH